MNEAYKSLKCLFNIIRVSKGNIRMTLFEIVLTGDNVDNILSISLSDEIL